MRQLYRVVEEYKAIFDFAFIAEKDETISVIKEDLETHKWYWCKNTSGLEAWIPGSHIEIDGKTATFNQPYNSQEQPAKPGEVVQYLGEFFGWVECLNSEWKYGWIPTNNLEKM